MIGKEEHPRNGMAEKRVSNRKRILTILFIALQAAAIFYTAYREYGDGDKVVIRLGRYGGIYLLAAFSCLLLFFAAESLKYMIMMRSLGEKASFRTALETVVIGKYYDSITPTGSGGQPFQVYRLHKKGYSSGAASAMPVLAFITSQGAFILISIFVFLFRRSQEAEALRYTAYAGLLLISFLPALLVAFTWLPAGTERLVRHFIKLGGKLRILKKEEETEERVMRVLSGYRDSIAAISGKRLLPKLVGISLVSRTAVCSIAWFVLRALGADASYFHITAVTVYLLNAIAVVPTPGHGGAAEGGFYLVFAEAGTEGVFWAMLLWRFFTYYLLIAGGALVFLADMIGRKRQKS